MDAKIVLNNTLKHFCVHLGFKKFAKIQNMCQNCIKSNMPQVNACFSATFNPLKLVRSELGDDEVIVCIIQYFQCILLKIRDGHSLFFSRFILHSPLNFFSQIDITQKLIFRNSRFSHRLITLKNGGLLFLKNPKTLIRS